MFITPAFAQGAAPAPGGGTAFLLQSAPLILIFGIFYFLLIRPQQQAAKAQRAKIDAVKRGDQVVTGGGLLGKVTKVDADQVEIEIASGVKVRAMTATLGDVLTPKPAND